MRVGDILVFNKIGKKIYIDRLTKHQWKILKINERGTEVLLVKPEDYDYFYGKVEEYLTTSSLNQIYEIIWQEVDYELYPYAAIHVSNLQLHRVESHNKDNTDKLKGVPEEFFKTPE